MVPITALARLDITAEHYENFFDPSVENNADMYQIMFLKKFVAIKTTVLAGLKSLPQTLL